MADDRLRVESGPPQHMIDDTGEGRVQEKAGEAKEQAAEVAGQAKEKAGEVAGQAKEHAQAAAEQARQKASAQVDERTTQVGEQLGSQAETLGSVAEKLRSEGKDGPADIVEKAGEKVRGVASYLENADGEKLVDAASNIARENPAAAAAAGAAAGFVAGRVIKASKPDDPAGGTPETPGRAG